MKRNFSWLFIVFSIGLFAACGTPTDGLDNLTPDPDTLKPGCG